MFRCSNSRPSSLKKQQSFALVLELPRSVEQKHDVLCSFTIKASPLDQFPVTAYVSSKLCVRSNRRAGRGRWCTVPPICCQNRTQRRLAHDKGNPAFQSTSSTGQSRQGVREVFATQMPCGRPQIRFRTLVSDANAEFPSCSIGTASSGIPECCWRLTASSVARNVVLRVKQLAGCRRISSDFQCAGSTLQYRPIPFALFLFLEVPSQVARSKRASQRRVRVLRAACDFGKRVLVVFILRVLR
jgi:hypothetical protein